jgi:hypothetical protein
MTSSGIDSCEVAAIGSGAGSRPRWEAAVDGLQRFEVEFDVGRGRVLFEAAKLPGSGDGRDVVAPMKYPRQHHLQRDNWSR